MLTTSSPLLLRWLRAGLLLLLGSAPFAAAAQAPAWQWAVTTTVDGRTLQPATDAAGNVYCVGFFNDSAVFGATTLRSTGAAQGFVAKCSAQGVWQWAAAFGGPGATSARSLAVDRAGNVVVAGDFQGASLRIGAFTVPNAGPADSSDVFVARLSAAGTWQWAVGAGGPGVETASAVTTDSIGAVYVAGTFSSSIVEIGPVLGVSYGGTDVFVAKLSAAGAWQWAATGGGDTADVSAGLAVDTHNGVYLAGTFSDAAFLGATAIYASRFRDRDAFVAQLDATTGTWQWSASGGGANPDKGYGVACDARGHVYLSGTLTGYTAQFGALPLTPTASTSVFVACLTTAGQWQWVTAAGPAYTVGSALGATLAVAPDGSSYLAGDFRRLGTALGATFGATTLVNAGLFDVFVAKLTPTGTWAWAIQGGANWMETASGLALHGDDLYLTGSFTTSTQFGPIVLAGGSNYLAKLTTNPLGLPAAPAAPPFTLAPNPAHRSVRLAGTAAATATFVDALGRVVRTRPVSASGEVDLTGLAPGLYTVRTGTQARRLVVE